MTITERPEAVNHETKKDSCPPLFNAVKQRKIKQISGLDFRLNKINKEDGERE